MDICEKVEALERDLAARRARQVEVRGEIKDLERKYRAAAAGTVSGVKPLDSPREIRDQIETKNVELDGLAELVARLEGELREKEPLAETEKKQRREIIAAENYHAAEVKGRAILTEVERACAGLATALKILDGFDPGVAHAAIKTGVETAAVGVIEKTLGAPRVEALARNWIKTAARAEVFTQVIGR